MYSPARRLENAAACDLHLDIVMKCEHRVRNKQSNLMEAAESAEAAPTVSAPSAAVVQAEEPQVLTSAARAARLRHLDQRHDEAPGA